MTADRSLGGVLVGDPLPEGFSRRVFRVASGHEVGPELCRLPNAIVVVEHGELELVCRKGARRRFGRGSMIPIPRLPVAHLRSVGPGPLVLVAVWRASLPVADEFLGASDRTSTAEYEFGG